MKSFNYGDSSCPFWYDCPELGDVLQGDSKRRCPKCGDFVVSEVIDIKPVKGHLTNYEFTCKCKVCGTKFVQRADLPDGYNAISFIANGTKKKRSWW
jgi:uncharacterized Zn finger protein